MDESNSQKNNMNDLKSEERSMFVNEREYSENLYKIRLSELNLKEKSEILDFRKKWSSNLLWLVVLIVLFNGVFLVVVGRKWLVYNDEWLVRIIFTGSFVEVLGLARIVVQFLFKETNKN
jgi:hypothetical protein